MPNSIPEEDAQNAPGGFMNWCRRQKRAILLVKGLQGVFGAGGVEEEVLNPELPAIVEEAENIAPEIKAAEGLESEAAEVEGLPKDIKALGESTEEEVEERAEKEANEEIEKGSKKVDKEIEESEKAAKAGNPRVPPRQKPSMPKSQTQGRQPWLHRSGIRGK